MEAGRVDRRSELVHGVELSHWEKGRGPAVLCLHETAATGEIWRPLAESLAAYARVIVPDRRGWGASGAPEQYSATTIEEQAEDAAELAERIDAGHAVVCGAGLGAVVALDLLLRRPDIARAAVLIEPPLLALVPEATEGLSTDRQAIESAVAEGGPEAAFDLYLGGGLPYAGAGAMRIPAPIGAEARRQPLSLFAELAAVPAWALRPSQLAGVDAPSRVAVCASTPAPLRRAAQELTRLLGGSEPLELGVEDLPHVGAAPDLAQEIRALP